MNALFDYDLQLFAEDADTATDTTADTADATADDTVDIGVEDTEPEQEPIPPELEGLSEDVAREAMAAAKEQTGETTEESDHANADANSDNNTQPGAVKPPKAKVPYARFKEAIDKGNTLESRNKELEAKLAEYERRFGGQQQATPQQPQYTPAQQPQQVAPAANIPQLHLTPQVAQRVNAAIQARAKQIAGMSDEDIESLDYAEANDERKATWSMAQEYAKQEVVNAIQREQQRQILAQQQFLQAHNQIMQDLDNFVANAVSEDDSKQIQDFATNEYLQQMSPVDQQAVISAYNRFQQRIANGQDAYALKTFYNAARAAYRAKGSNGKRKNSVPRPSAAAMPRAGKVQGNSGGNGAVTLDTLLEMEKETPWSKIPQDYRDMLMGIKPLPN